MNIKKVLICLSIAAILSVCMPNVIAAPTSKPSATTRDGCTTDVRTHQPTTLTLTVPSNQAKANESFNVYIRLITVTGIVIPFAPINFEQRYSGDDRWVAVGIEDTDLFGNLQMQQRIGTPGEYHLRATYYGDSQNFCSVSNEIAITII